MKYGFRIGCGLIAILSLPVALAAEDTKVPPVPEPKALPAAESSIAPALEGKFREAVELYQRGKTKESLEAFEEVLKMDPSHDQTFRLREIVGLEVFVQILGEGGRIKKVAEYFLERARAGEIERLTDEKKATELARTAVFGKFEERWEAIRELIRFGELGAKCLAPFLGNEVDPTARSHAIVGLTKLHQAAVLPMLAALDSPSVLIRQNAAIVLGNIRDSRAVASLQALAEKPGEDTAVVRLVAESLKKLTGREATEVKDAASCYHERAKLYFENHPSTAKSPLGKFWIWKWGVSGLEYREVPGYLYFDQLAEDSLVRGLSLVPEHKPSWALLGAILLNKYEKTVSLQRALRREKKEEEAKALDGVLADVTRDRNRAIACGSRSLCEALTMILTTQQARLSSSLLTLLADGLPATALPESSGKGAAALGIPVIQALDSPDKMVRVQAAVTAALLNPPYAIPSGDKVVANLVEGITTTSERTALVVSDAAQQQNTLAALLTACGFFTSRSQNAFDGLLRARQFPDLDLLVLDAETETVPAIKFYQQLTQDPRTCRIPIAIVGPASELIRLRRLYEKAAACLPYEVTARQVKEELLPVAGAKEDFKAEAVALSARAAEALAHVGESRTFFPVAASQKGLSGIVKKWPDPVRLPVLRVLAQVGVQEDLVPLLRLAQDEGESLTVRKGALAALGGVLSRLSATPEEIRISLDRIMKQAQEPELLLGATRAMGRATMPDKDRTLILF